MPINLRKFWKIKKGTSNKSLALFAQAYLNYYLVLKNQKFLDEAIKVLDMLEKNSIKTDEGVGWASYYFVFLRKGHLLSPEQIDIIATTEALKAYSTAYAVTKNEKYGYMAENIVREILSEFVGNYKEWTYIRYFPDEKEKIVFNVPGLTLSAMYEYIKNINEKKDLLDLGVKLMDFLVHNQNEEGAWPYSYFVRESRYHYQIDYHQGFIIDGLVNFNFLINDEKYHEAILRGINYYKTKQFNEGGYSYYRNPKKYPIDIHNQAQGIITFSELYEKFRKKEYLDFANKVYGWTVENMWDNRGYFYTHKWPIVINKIPYIRWSQAWMMVALAKLMMARREYDETNN